MRDFPMLTTENGVASLVFREIPYRGIAYIRIQSTLNFPALLQECRDFALAVGAQQIFATGHEALTEYPFYTAVYRLAAQKEQIPEGNASIFPVTQQTLEEFRQIYNRRMAHVPNSAYMTRALAQETLSRGEGYFVHRDGELLGIGILSGEELKAMASCKKGAGTQVLRTLCHGVMEDRVILECASENQKALDLYQREGFLIQKELSCWYKII